MSYAALSPPAAPYPILRSTEYPQGPDCASDAVLVAALRQGEEWAIETLYVRYTPALHGIALRYVHNPTHAEDIVQETWIGVLRSIARFEGRSSLKTWIFRILHYRARTWRSKEKNTISFSLLQGADPDAGPTPERLVVEAQAVRHLQPAPLEEHALAAETGAAILTAIDTLPATQRAVVMLRDVAGWPAADVCRRLHLSAGNQRVLLHRARRRLRQLLGSYGRQRSM